MAQRPAPYAQKKRITLPDAGANEPGSIQLFPWTIDSAGKIFNARWRASDQWTSMIDEFSDAFLVGRGSGVFILYTGHKPATACFSLDASDSDSQDHDTTHAAWALRSSYPFDPLVLVAYHRRIFIWHVRQNTTVGYLRGHGGRITSIAVHPTSPNIFATTSSDFTTRIYNLDLPGQPNENPAWSPRDRPSCASAAHGMDGPDSEGSGSGRCIQILVGGRSGGHAWDVLGAAFHPRLPLIVTCGADRHVKIWRFFSNWNETVKREDKPLFSARITTSRVLSIAWLSDDVLVMHTATTHTPSRANGEDNQELVYDHDEPGAIDVVQWLGLNRFFPNGHSDPNTDPVLRGGSSDYQESKSYTILSTMLLPRSLQPGIEPISNISQPRLDFHTRFLLVYPDSRECVLVDVSKMAPRTLPSNNYRDDSLVEMTKRMRFDDTAPAAQEPSLTGHLFQHDDTLKTNVAACARTISDLIILLSSKGNVWILKKRSH
ncbi:WD40-repeat-containing domain protein [Mycena pura]|uniref:WD40-repeat-containing domain protein n=1 Tax=Mycena pura TaxID=153505 RepID=A0AAD6YPG0_9AGAR|nr:WD40-repeat-containing domain protein [Mycena pura]